MIETYNLLLILNIFVEIVTTSDLIPMKRQWKFIVNLTNKEILEFVRW
jgi:hypothetical protein